MTPEALEQILDVLDVLVTLGIVVAAFFRFRGKQQSLTVLFFCFAMVSLFLTNAYWLAHSLMRPNLRMPLAANTIGECAVFLLLSAAMNAAFPHSRFSFAPQIICAAVFIAASIALWIAWSGEWLQDLLGGIAFGYFLLVCVRDLCHTGAFDRKEWIALGIFCTVYMGIFVFWTFDGSQSVENVGYVLMFVPMLFFLYKSVRGIRNEGAEDRQIALSVSAYACCMSGIYMADEYWYIAAELLCLLSLPLMLQAFGKEADPV